MPGGREAADSAISGKTLPVVAEGASLRIRDRLGSVVLLYPTYRSLEFDLRVLRRPGREAEIRDLQRALQQIAGRTPEPTSWMLPNACESLATRSAL
jgi:hypothetical protein